MSLTVSATPGTDQNETVQLGTRPTSADIIHNRMGYRKNATHATISNRLVNFMIRLDEIRFLPPAGHNTRGNTDLRPTRNRPEEPKRIRV